MSYVYTTMDSPVGRLKLAASREGLAAILWPHDDVRRVRLGAASQDDDHPILRAAVGQLQDYFAGTRTSFDLTLAPLGTAFQKEVWAALWRIPFGETRSYGQIAKALGRPKAVRAVGAANGRNPISIVIPCHRVIGAAGALTGFAGGLDAKAKLLSIEGHRYGEGVTAVSKRVGGRSPRQADLFEAPDLFGG